jgi:OOP family OmpA-OmpF porin
MARTSKKLNQRLAALDRKPTASGKSGAENPFAPGPGGDESPVLDTTAFVMVAVLGFIVLSALAVVFGIQRVENDLEQRAEQALRSNQIEDVEVVATGQDLVITGTVREENQVDGAVGLVASVPGVRNVDPNVEWVPPRITEEVDLVADPLVVAWSGPNVVVTGTVSDEATREAVVEIAEATWTNADTAGLVVVPGLAAERDWLPAILRLSQEMAERISLGEIVANPAAGVVKVSAEFETRQEHREAKDKTEDILASVTLAFSSGLTVKDAPRPTLQAVTELQEDIDKLILGQVVEFETASDVITESGKQLLDEVFAALEQFPAVPIEIAGHTDDQGTSEYNMDLSRRRADAVLAYLVARGADSARFVVVAYGETRPVADNESPEGRARNRRIEFTALEE